VRVPLDEAGQPGAVQDFAAGWLREDGSNWGRPVDVQTGADGSFFISDDGAGFIYRVFYADE
jgi:glucose/arabinose dehydrogenase